MLSWQISQHGSDILLANVLKKVSRFQGQQDNIQKNGMPCYPVSAGSFLTPNGTVLNGDAEEWQTPSSSILATVETAD